MIRENAVCPICSGLGREYVSYNVYKCDYCGHGFHYPGVKNEKELHKYYDQEYAKEYSPDIKTIKFLQRHQQYKEDIKLLKKVMGKGKISVLDYGCSTGQFLNVMPNNWKKHGYEINETEIKYIKKNYKDIKIVTELPTGKYDIITLRGVIEHLYNFNKIFNIINKCLKKDGIVFICATPDFSSPCATVYRGLWNQIDSPRHYHQFTSASITLLFAKHGFGLKAMEHGYIETPYADFKKDSRKFIENVNRIGNDLYPIDTNHAYPGTMMSMVFQKVIKDETRN